MDSMHRHRISLSGRLAGISRATSDNPTSAPLQPPPAPAVQGREPAPDTRALENVLTELARLTQEVRTQTRSTIGEVAQLSVELAAALAERLLSAEIGANRQRLERIVLQMLERMQASQSVAVRGHPDDLALLQRQFAELSDLDRYRDLLTFRPEETFQRGRLKLEADELFVEWDTSRCLAELRAALIEETFLDE